MKATHILIFTVLIFGFCMINMSCKESNSKTEKSFKGFDLSQNKDLIIQLAELSIDPAQLNDYLEFLREEVQASVEKEPGVYMLYSMQDAAVPTSVKLIEIYANQNAYESHIASPHFQKYKQGTMSMVDSLTLTRMDPVDLASKWN